MKLRLALLTIALAAAALAQQPTAATNASIRGVVKEAGTGRPLANYNVTTDVNATWVDNTIVMSAATKEVKSVTDDSGRYELRDLPPGPYRITASGPQGGFLQRITRTAVLGSHDLDGIDFSFVAEASIAGRVFDENQEPIPGMTVLLVSKEYYLGALGYFFKNSARTNDRGEYTLTRVPAGRPYVILAEKRGSKIPAHSEVPLNPRLRRRVPMRTWYPNVLQKESAIAVMLSPGERREGIDIEVRKSPSYCIEGTLLPSNSTGPLDFYIEAQQPSSGASASGGMYVVSTNGTTSRDGQFRICDLYPGTHRLTAFDRSDFNTPPASYVVTTIAIADHDLNNLKFAAVPGVTLDGEVVWDGEPPQSPVSAKLSVSLFPLLRASLGGQNFARVNIPDKFSMPSVLIDDYTVRAFLTSPGLYVKDVTYADRSVLNEPLRIGSAIGNAGLRVIVGHDGATLSARVADKDGNPLADMQVLLLPAEIRSEADLQSKLITGATDQLGNYKSRSLAPGKYFIAATADSFDSTVESINKLWRSRNRFTEVDLAPNGTAQVTLEPVKIE